MYKYVYIYIYICVCVPLLDGANHIQKKRMAGFAPELRGHDPMPGIIHDDL